MNNFVNNVAIDFVCVCVSSIKVRSAASGTTGTHHGQIRKLQIKPHLFYNWSKKLRRQGNRLHSQVALSLFTAGN